MGRRYSGNVGGGTGARAIAGSQTVPAQTGTVMTLVQPNLLKPLTFSKTGGNTNLSVDGGTGAVSAAIALSGGLSQVVSGAISGADGVIVPFSVTLIGAAVAPALPAAPALTITPGSAQASLAWVDGADGGSSITAHKLYRGTSAGGETLVGTITTASPFIDGGLTNGTRYYYKLSAVNGVGEGALSPESGATPTAATSTAVTPPNWDFIAYGDSRTENAVGATLGSSGYQPSSSNIGPAAYVPIATANRLRLARYPNYGISASTTTQGAAVPRLSAVNTLINSTPQTWARGTDSQNKGADYAANSGAGIVVVLYGTNDAQTDLPVNSRNNILAILNNLKSTQLKIVFNECPKGIKATGASTSYGTSAAFKDYSVWLSSLDYASGSANARSDVIVVDLWGDAFDSATGNNKVGFLRDGLHFTPWGAKRAAKLLHDRLTAVYGSAYTALPAQAVLPVSNGASIATDTIGSHAPFVHGNPLLTPGTNGAIQGTNFGTAPAVTTVPQGWKIEGTSGQGSGISVSCDKTGTDPDGYPMWTITVSGTLADSNTYTLSMYQQSQVNTVTVTDKLRGIARLQVASGSQQLQTLKTRIYVQDATATKSQTAIALQGSSGSTGDRDGYLVNSSGSDAGGTSDFVLTQLLDLADPNMSAANGGPGVVASISNAIFYIDAAFVNYTGATAVVSATIQISRAGMFKATS